MPTAGVEQQQTFQFHKGAIKTQLLFTGSFTASQFQFHKGTIKTLNSKPLLTALTDFNSIKVRLKHAELKTSFDRFDGFQFHKGTIKTASATACSLVFNYFNSIKVRLKPITRALPKRRRLISIP